MNGPPASIPEHWKMCSTASRFHSAVSGLLHDPQPPQEHGHETLANHKVLEKRDGTLGEGEWYVFPFMWHNSYITSHFTHSFLGELTDLGRQAWVSSWNSFLILNWLQSTFALGRDLRRLYIDRYAVSRSCCPRITSPARYRLGFIPDTLSDKDFVYFRYTKFCPVLSPQSHCESGPQICHVPQNHSNKSYMAFIQQKNVIPLRSLPFW